MMKHPQKAFPSGQPMDIPCRVIGEYLQFNSEMDCDDYEEAFCINASRYCVDGYLNGFKLSDVNS